ncbi:hypothetical protein [Bacillus sp. 'calajunan']|uniref:hypothetical protein n=1 Tax=Bacillus sp. 'calajunan' TaxID=3447457 RepID=UPI003EE0F23E
MDKVFKQNTASVPDAIMVYRYTDEQQFGIAPGTFFPKDPKNPKETHAVYMGNEYAELILPRNASLKIKKVSGIVEKGKLIVKVDASVINK